MVWACVSVPATKNIKARQHEDVLVGQVLFCDGRYRQEHECLKDVERFGSFEKPGDHNVRVLEF